MSQVKEFPLSDEYKKDTGIGPEDVRMFREWLVTQPHLPAEHITDLDLILIYHSCERSFALSKELLDLHFTTKTIINSFFKDRKFDNRIENALNCCLLKPLPKTKEGYACLYCGIINDDLKTYNFGDGIRALFMILDLWQYEEGTWPGIIFILDLQGLTIGHMSKFDLKAVQEFIYVLQEGTLLKMKSIHVINASSLLENLMLLGKPFIKNLPLSCFIYIRLDQSYLKSFIQSKIYHEKQEGHTKDEVIAKLKSNDEYFLMESRKRVNETQRSGKSKMIADFSGSLEGSFKKLDID